jgi:hypothetical protein
LTATPDPIAGRGPDRGDDVFSPRKKIRPHRKGLTWLAAAVILLCAACSSAPRAPSLPTGGAGTDALEQHLRRAAREWEGTPHRLGGLDRHGIDCSGLVVRIYDDLFSYRLPRTTGRQARTGQPTEGRTLAPGDLVFFRIPPRKQHVGIYLGGGEFVHASARRGVAIDRLDTPYWRGVFWTARRILIDNPR